MRKYSVSRFIAVLISLLGIVFGFFVVNSWFQNHKHRPKQNVEPFQMQQKHDTAFCLLTRRPNVVWLDFLTTFTENYDVFVVIDDQDDFTNITINYPTIIFVSIPDEECITSGYLNSDYMFKPVVSTDRAYYYFNRLNTNYKNIWFCEDDVFINDKNVILNLDAEYPNVDLIAPGNELNVNGSDSDGWMHWTQVNNTLPLPWAHYLICLCRISNRLMKQADNYVLTHGTLNFKEFLFHTLAIHNEMSIEVPVELKTIQLGEFTQNNVDKVKTYQPIYHKMKNMDDHVGLRNQYQY